MAEYPKYKYHKTGNPVIVNSKEDEDSLEGYEDSPTAHGLPPTAPSVEQMDEAALALKDAREQVRQEVIGDMQRTDPFPTDEALRRVDLATAQRTVKKAPNKVKSDVKPLDKTSGDDKFGGDWTLAGTGTDYPREAPATEVK